MRKLNSDEIKHIELDLLIEFDSFCKKEDLQYFLYGGTLLGAVRHKGFIPWDDDIDVAMFRSDYNCMIDLLMSCNLRQDIDLCCLKKGNSEYPFAKLVNKNTKIVEKYLDKKDYSHIWIDIFPLDDLPESMQQYKKLCRQLKLTQRLLGISHANLNEGKSRLKKAGKKILYPLSKMIGSYKLANYIEKKAESFSSPKSQYVQNLVWASRPQWYLPKKIYNSTTNLEFEGHLFPAPKEYNTCLKILYGDYMTLPPVEERITHDFIAYINDDK